MVRPSDQRKRMYEAKVDPEILATQTRVLKALMVREETRYFPVITTIEEKVKKLVEGEGVPTIQVRDYLNFGREMYELTRKFSGSTLRGEAQLRVNKWGDRGLAGTLLVKIAELFGVTPSTPPTPPIIMFFPDGTQYLIIDPENEVFLLMYHDVYYYDPEEEGWKWRYNNSRIQLKVTPTASFVRWSALLNKMHGYFMADDLSSIFQLGAEDDIYASSMLGTVKPRAGMIKIDAEGGTKTIQLGYDSAFSTEEQGLMLYGYDLFILVGKVASLPTAEECLRGRMIRVEGGPGVPDRLYICEWNGSTWIWRQI